MDKAYSQTLKCHQLFCVTTTQAYSAYGRARLLLFSRPILPLLSP